MQALILVAGKGQRLGKFTHEKNRCMIPIHGQTLIERTLNHMAEQGIQRVILVIGYQGESIRQFLGETYQGMEIIYIVNERYEQTNNIYFFILQKHC